MLATVVFAEAVSETVNRYNPVIDIEIPDSESVQFSYLEINVSRKVQGS